MTELNIDDIIQGRIAGEVLAATATYRQTTDWLETEHKMLKQAVSDIKTTAQLARVDASILTNIDKQFEGVAKTIEELRDADFRAERQSEAFRLEVSTAINNLRERLELIDAQIEVLDKRGDGHWHSGTGISIPEPVITQYEKLWQDYYRIHTYTLDAYSNEARNDIRNAFICGVETGEKRAR